MAKNDPPALRELIGMQDCLISRAQALGAGMSENAIRHRVREGGPWRACLPGVYLTVTGTPTRVQRETAAIRLMEETGPDGAPPGNRRFAYYVDVRDVDRLFAELKPKLATLPTKPIVDLSKIFPRVPAAAPALPAISSERGNASRTSG